MRMDDQHDDIPGDVMDVVITGAGGRIGSQVARALMARGHRIRAVDVVASDAVDGLAAAGAEVFLGSLADTKMLARACAGADAVVAAGAVLSSHGKADDLLIDANFVGAYNLLVAARDNAPRLRRYVNLSSDAVYWGGGPVPAAALPVTEHFPRTGSSVYAATKVGGEQLCTSFLHTYGLPTVTARPTMTAAPIELVTPDSVFGRRWFVGGALRWWDSRPALSSADAAVRQMLADGKFDEDDLFVVLPPDGTPNLSMINDARDVAAGICLMLEKAEAVGHAFNLGSTEYSDLALVRYIGRQLGRTVHTLTHHEVRPSWYVSSVKARAILGYQPRHNPFSMVDEALGLEAAPSAIAATSEAGR